MANVMKDSDVELISRYVDLSLLKETESMKMEKCDWSIIEKYNDELLIVEDALKSRRLELEAEEKLLIKQGRISEERVDELKKISTEKLESELEDGEQIMDEYYGNTFYIQKYEDDESFRTAGNHISAENSIISLILKDRGNKEKQESREVTEIPLIADNEKEDENKKVAVSVTDDLPF